MPSLVKASLLLLVLTCNAAWARQATAQASGAGPAYEAGCRFIGREEVWATGFAEALGTRPKEKLGTTGAYGATAYRHVEEGMQLEYVLTSEGRVLVSSFTVSGRYLERRQLTGRSVAQELLLPHPLPDELETGCDTAEMTVSSRRGELVSVTISFLID